MILPLIVILLYIFGTCSFGPWKFTVTCLSEVERQSVTGKPFSWFDNAIFHCVEYYLDIFSWIRSAVSSANRLFKIFFRCYREVSWTHMENHSLEIIELFFWNFANFWDGVFNFHSTFYVTCYLESQIIVSRYFQGTAIWETRQQIFASECLPTLFSRSIFRQSRAIWSYSTASQCFFWWWWWWWGMGWGGGGGLGGGQ